jgi:hypothetical protein
MSYLKEDDPQENPPRAIIDAAVTPIAPVAPVAHPPVVSPPPSTPDAGHSAIVGHEPAVTAKSKSKTADKPV